MPDLIAVNPLQRGRSFLMLITPELVQTVVRDTGWGDAVSPRPSQVLLENEPLCSSVSSWLCSPAPGICSHHPRSSLGWYPAISPRFEIPCALHYRDTRIKPLHK